MFGKRTPTDYKINYNKDVIMKKSPYFNEKIFH